MSELPPKEVERMLSDKLRSNGRMEGGIERILARKKYTTLHSRLSGYIEDNLFCSMTAYRFENNPGKSIQFLQDAQSAVSRINDLKELLVSLEGIDTSHEPNCLLPVFFEYPVYLSLLNKRIEDVDVLYATYHSPVTKKDAGFAFSQQFPPLLMAGILGKEEEFYQRYEAFNNLKKDSGEQWFAHYIDMLKAIIERDQSSFDALLLDAEGKMKSHGISKKWGDDIMSGGLEYNSIVYDYQGTALCCLAKMRGMKVNHFSYYYPEEIIEKLKDTHKI